MADKSLSRRRAPAGESAASQRQWRKVFLAELAATSNVAASARKAGISASRAYEVRRQNAEFHREWQEALCEGYDHLEMNLLHRLREGEIRPAAGARRGTRVFDNTTALRLLALHRDSVTRQRAVQDNRNSEAILAAIDARIDRIRQRKIKEQSGPQALPAPAQVVDGGN